MPPALFPLPARQLQGVSGDARTPLIKGCWLASPAMRLSDVMRLQAMLTRGSKKEAGKSKLIDTVPCALLVTMC